MENLVINNLNQFKAEIIGYVAVDTAMILISDPAYAIEAFEENSKLKLHVITKTRNGDGNFPVIGFYEEGSFHRPSFIIVDFDNIFIKES